MVQLLAPIKNVHAEAKGWEGHLQKKPWDYKVTAAIPVMDTPEELELVVSLLRLQTEKPYIIVIDTGSEPENLAKIESMRAEDLEVHVIKLNGVEHPSDFVTMAMDLAFSCCRTEYMFATHADCFLRRKDFIEYLLGLTNKDNPAVGYQISPRKHNDWKGMLGHTASMYHMPTMDQIGFGWSMRRLCNLFGIENKKPDPMKPNWPDTELLGNYILRSRKITPVLIGEEENFKPTIDENIYHARTLTSGKLYCPEYYNLAKQWADDAMAEARQNILKWSQESNSSSIESTDLVKDQE